jgi:tripartite-type tricarboxylate transporter receptor subunit TctC
MITRRTLVCRGVLAASLPLTAFAADKFPAHPLRVLVPNTPGSTSDLIARIFADQLAKKLGQPVVVDNRPGAGGVIAAQATVQAPRDGYTLLFVNSQHAINPAVYDKLPFDTLRDFEGLALVGDTPSVIVVAPQLGVRTLKEFVALAKQKPGQIAYASGGVGSQTHLSGAYFASRAGISLLHVPYKSAADVISDIATNRTQSTFAPAAYLLPHIQAKRLVAIAVTGRERLSTLPDVPTVAETVIPGYEFSTWLGFVTGANVPAPVATQLAQDLRSIANDPTVKRKMAEQSITPRVLVQKEFDAYIKAQIETLAPVVKASGMKAKAT